jgi:hypothetical protein
MRVRRLLPWLALSGLFTACSTSSSSTPPADPTGTCRAIAGACHRYDKGGGFPHECHEIGHAGDDNACAPKKDACLAACPPLPDAGNPADAGSGEVDADTDAADAQPVDVCVAYCDCMGTTCSSQTGYPYAAADSCMTACHQFDPGEKKCWPNFCAEASQGGPTKDHLCEHGWGKFGLDECE